IALKPKLIVLDESISSLDMVHQTQILSLLGELRASYGLSYLFITHDIRAAMTICDCIAVMDQGRIVYSGDAGDSVMKSDHPAVQQLVTAILPEHPSGRISFR
ncbi:nickel import ATP-binding protein NikE, partial [Clostridioides difficile]